MPLEGASARPGWGSGSSPRVGYTGTIGRGQWSGPKQQKQDGENGKTSCWTPVSRLVQPNLPARSSRNCWTWIWTWYIRKPTEGRELTCKGGTRHPGEGRSQKSLGWKVLQGVLEAWGYEGTLPGLLKAKFAVSSETVKSVHHTLGSVCKDIVGPMLLKCLRRSAVHLGCSRNYTQTIALNLVFAHVVSSDSLKLHIYDHLCLSLKSSQPTTGLSSMCNLSSSWARSDL